jgi:hypothetical protein
MHMGLGAREPLQSRSLEAIPGRQRTAPGKRAKPVSEALERFHINRKEKPL